MLVVLVATGKHPRANHPAFPATHIAGREANGTIAQSFASLTETVLL